MEIWGGVIQEDLETVICSCRKAGKEPPNEELKKSVLDGRKSEEGRTEECSRHFGRASKMAQRVKMVIDKSEDVNSIPGTHLAEGNNSGRLSSAISVRAMTCAHHAKHAYMK